MISCDCTILAAMKFLHGSSEVHCFWMEHKRRIHIKGLFRNFSLHKIKTNLRKSHVPLRTPNSFVCTWPNTCYFFPLISNYCLSTSHTLMISLFHILSPEYFSCYNDQTTVRFPEEKKSFVSSQRLHKFWDPSTLLANECHKIFPWE
jgi:hypothetical protein